MQWFAKRRRRRPEKPSSPARRALVVILAALATAALLWMFVFLPAQSAGRRQALAFDGVIEKKQAVADQSKYSPGVRYILIIRKETGELVRLQVSRAMYERARVGMPVRKKAGESWPTVGTGER